MKKVTGVVTVLLLFVFIVQGCSGTLSGNKPPNAFLEISNNTYDTKLGTYCWEDKCVDTVGPVELLEDEAPIPVQPGERITIGMDYSPKPNETSLAQISNEKETEVELADYQFSTPTKKGVYYYVYQVRWKEEQKENVSQGDAYYAFAVEVQ